MSEMRPLFANAREIEQRVKQLRLEIEGGVVGRQTGTCQRAAALQIVGLLLQAEGVAARALLDIEPIDGRASLALS